jgi:uncharacterized membrane protein YcaP (DUF421 family)
MARDRLPWLREAVEGTPTVLMTGGRFLRKNMQKEGVEEEEIMMAARQQGVADAKNIKLAVLETDGSISVVRADSDSGDKPSGHRRRRRLFRKR